MNQAPDSAAGFASPKILRPWHFAVLVAALLLLIGLASYPLLDPDEGRYAEIAREMLESHDLFALHYNYTPYLDKPPLMYFAVAVDLLLFGDKAWAVRLVPALSGILGMLVVWWLASLVLPKAVAHWAPPVLATSLLYFILARDPVIDMLFSMLVAAMLTAWYASYLKPQRRGRLLALSGLALGLAMLAKGPVAAVMLVMIVGAFLVWQRQWKLLLAGLGIPLLVGCAVAAPWFVTASLRVPGFAHYFFVVQHWERFTAHGYAQHVQPAYFYIPILFIGFAWWSLLWPQALTGWRVNWRNMSDRARTSVYFLLCWAGFIFLFFSASKCKLPTYILPMWWPVAVGTTLGVYKLLEPRELARGTRRSLYVAAGVVAIFGLGGMVYMSMQSFVPVHQLRLPAAVLIVTWFAAVLGLLWLPRLKEVEQRLLLASCLAAVALAGLLPATQVMAAERNVYTLLPAALRPAVRSPGWTFAQYKCYDPSFTFYTRARTVLIDQVNPLKWGPAQPDGDRWFLKSANSIDILSARGPLALIVDLDQADQIAAQHHLRIWAANLNRALLLNEAGWHLATSQSALS